jgi:hypothetical protein
MKSAQNGTTTSPVEVTNISINGIWIFIHDTEVFLSFEDFPWFEEALIKKILRVEMPSENHLYWPDLDIDLAVESVFHPERFPLVSKQRC